MRLIPYRAYRVRGVNAREYKAMWDGTRFRHLISGHPLETAPAAVKPFTGPGPWVPWDDAERRAA